MPSDEQKSKRRLTRGDAIQRASEGWALRVQGLTWQQIADRVGFASPQGAHRAVERFAGTIPDPKPDTLRELWRARMERLYQLADRDAEAGRPGALRAGVAIADRASKLDGLDQPTRVELETDAQLGALVNELLRRTGHPEVLDAEVVELDVTTTEIDGVDGESEPDADPVRLR